jgi:hypothetical protein
MSALFVAEVYKKVLTTSKLQNYKTNSGAGLASDLEKVLCSVNFGAKSRNDRLVEIAVVCLETSVGADLY